MRTGEAVELVLVLGSYPEAGRLALRNIRRSGIRRMAAITSLPGGRVVVEDGHGSSIYGATR
jgi:hypothetical protein